MATEALTYVAHRASHNRASTKKAPGHEQSWRQLITEEDADAIWRKLFALIESANLGSKADCNQLTQELFLHLLATGRLSHYINQKLSDEEIEKDLLSITTG